MTELRERVARGASRRNRTHIFTLRGGCSAIELGRLGKWRSALDSNQTAETASRLAGGPGALPVHAPLWRRVKESNPRPCRRPGFRDQLPTTERHPPFRRAVTRLACSTT